MNLTPSHAQALHSASTRRCVENLGLQRRRRLAVFAAALAGGLALPLVQPAHSAGATTTPVPPPEPVRIASFNTAAFLSTSEAVQDVTQIAAAGADIIALQEMSSPDRRAAVRAALVDCETCVYDFYVAPGGAVPAETPILYRRDRFQLLDEGSVQVTEATYVGREGAGPSTIRPKYVTWVRLKDLMTRRQVYVLNSHTVPSVQATDGGPNDNDARLAIYRKHMSGLQALVLQLRQATGGTMFVTGDFNVNYRKDKIVQAPMFPYVRMGAVAVHASYELLGEPELGTHILPSGYDKRLIDYVSVADNPAVVPVSQEILTGLNSDHRPILLEAGLRYKPKFFR